jgi:hypothetical protein
MMHHVAFVFQVLIHAEGRLARLDAFQMAWPRSCVLSLLKNCVNSRGMIPAIAEQRSIATLGNA